MLHKVYHPAGVSFKGSGYYVTDKRNSASAASKPKKGRDNGASETKTEGKAETKGETKSVSSGETKSEKSKPISKQD